MANSDVLRRNNVKVTGQGERTLMLAHGFGCDQKMWRFLIPALGQYYTLVLFDYVGSGNSELAAFDPQRYATLEGYAQDILDICEALELSDVTLVGHSVSSIIGLIASEIEPERFSRLVMLSPSPCFQNLPPDYYGGFEQGDLQDLLDLMDMNHIDWANYLAPVVMGQENGVSLVGELTDSFCSIDPVAAKTFAQATFTADYRHILSAVPCPTLIIQSKYDALAPEHIGHYMHASMPKSTLLVIDAVGHCPHMSHPPQVLDAILEFLSR
ncbi:alpha/beta hydrolase [Halomonas sp. Bachu 37]|uniref:alpha/beta fold hydrolase n=1 Tax=Halomonas kashgarensis TaxID=3084920 RepID=UPI00321739A5